MTVSPLCSGSGEQGQAAAPVERRAAWTETVWRVAGAGGSLEQTSLLSWPQGQQQTGKSASPLPGSGEEQCFLARDRGHYGVAFVLPEATLIHLFRTSLEPVLKAQS